MTNITAAMVKELRETTSAGMLDCKKALTETNGDMEQAIDWLRKKGLASAAKKASRIAAEGLVAVAVDGNKGAVVEVNSETDFVAKNEIFQEYVEDAAQVALMYKGEVCDMKTFQCPKVHKSFEERLTDMIAKIGENMNLRRAKMIEVNRRRRCILYSQCGCVRMSAKSVFWLRWNQPATKPNWPNWANILPCMLPLPLRNFWHIASVDPGSG